MVKCCKVFTRNVDYPFVPSQVSWRTFLILRRYESRTVASLQIQRVDLGTMIHCKSRRIHHWWKRKQRLLDRDAPLSGIAAIRAKHEVKWMTKSSSLSNGSVEMCRAMMMVLLRSRCCSEKGQRWMICARIRMTKWQLVDAGICVRSRKSLTLTYIALLMSHVSLAQHFVG